ncbi:MAG: ABC transporter ATP-binding protein [Clostridiales bacterium]|jgi:zinc transport system ATP-binding protein|nr:ABC transporter ATP-binding protein [Clostridiales bacterium]
MLMSVKNLCVAYDGKRVVDDVSFDILEGDYLCVVGENGSGKTTVMKALLGLVRPEKGSVECKISRREIGYLPQQNAVQKDFPASVYEVAVSGCLNGRGLFAFFTRADKKRTEKNLEKLGVLNLKRKPYRDLSGGQRQRVLIARALCASNKMLVLDEPVTGLDPMTSTELYALTNELNREGMTVVMVSHDIKNAVKYGNKILHMAKSAAFFGTAADYVKTDIYARMSGENA